MSDIELHAYYAACPGGHFQIADAPNCDAALAVLTQLFGYEAATKWLITKTEPDSRRLGGYNWLAEANESWLADNGWPELITILTTENSGFDDYDLCAILTEQRGDITAAVLRIAARYLENELADAEKAESAGVPGAGSHYEAILEDPVWFLYEAARASQQTRNPN